MPGKHPDKFKYITKITLFLVLAFTMLSGAAAHSSEVTLTWQAPDDDRVVGYYVFYGPAPYDFDSADPNIVINDPAVTSCTLTDLTPGVEYQVAMKSFDANGNESELSEIISFTAPEEQEDPDNGSDDGDDGSGDDGGSDDGSSDPDTDTGFDESYEDIFHAIGFFHNSEFGTEYLNLGFDGQGGLKIVSIANSSASSDGTVTTETTSTFFADGEISIEDGLIKGAISPDRSFFAIGNMDEANPSTAFGIRQASGLYPEDFMGEYRVFMVAVTSEAQNSPEIKQGVLSADGTNALMPVTDSNLEFSAFYYIDENGHLLLEPENPSYSEMHGALSANGRIFAAVDADNNDGTLLFIIGMRIAEDGLDTEPSGGYYVNEFRYEDSETPAAYFLELLIRDDMNYEAYEIDSSSENTEEPAGGSMVVDETGRIEVSSDNSGENFTGAVLPGGEVLVLQDDTMLGISIKQSSDSQDDSSQENEDAATGGCFIGSLLLPW
ncbi:MAG: fibronectin type III domain-containing protein [Desulfobacteraceae bacterium]|nr:fibronectin type III domain-containing protein [Desulfobacteraceae bacterium]